MNERETTRCMFVEIDNDVDTSHGFLIGRNGDRDGRSQVTVWSDGVIVVDITEGRYHMYDQTGYATANGRRTNGERK